MRLVGKLQVLQVRWPTRYREYEDRYYARCEQCEWRCHVTPHLNKEVAERCKVRHTVSKHPPEMG